MKLRMFEEKDATCILSWFSDELSFRKWSAECYPQYPATEEQMCRLYEKMAEEGPFWPFSAEEEGQLVGHLILRKPREGEIRFGFIAVDASKRGRGYGKGMLKKAVQLALEQYGAHRITLGVFENNPSARYCYEAVGFVPTGEQVACRVVGENWTWLEMEYKEE